MGRVASWGAFSSLHPSQEGEEAGQKGIESPGARQLCSTSERLPGATVSHSHSASPESPMGDTPPSFPLRVRAALWPVPDQLVRVISPGHRYLGPGLRGANKGWKICTQGRDFKSSSSHQRIQKKLRRSFSASSLCPKSYCVLKTLLSQRQSRLWLIWGKSSDQCLLPPTSYLSIPRQTSADKLSVAVGGNGQRQERKKLYLRGLDLPGGPACDLLGPGVLAAAEPLAATVPAASKSRSWPPGPLAPALPLAADWPIRVTCKGGGRGCGQAAATPLGVLLQSCSKNSLSRQSPGGEISEENAKCCLQGAGLHPLPCGG